MSYTGRHRYRTRREKYQRNTRHLKMVFIFVMITLVILIWKNRYDIISWIKTYFM